MYLVIRPRDLTYHTFTLGVFYNIAILSNSPPRPSSSRSPSAPARPQPPQPPSSSATVLAQCSSGGALPPTTTHTAPQAPGAHSLRRRRYRHAHHRRVRTGRRARSASSITPPSASSSLVSCSIACSTASPCQRAPSDRSRSPRLCHSTHGLPLPSLPRRPQSERGGMECVVSGLCFH